MNQNFKQNGARGRITAQASVTIAEFWPVLVYGMLGILALNR